MSNVIKLNANAVTPEDVLESVSKRIPDMKDICVVIKTHKGEFAAWSSGDTSIMAQAGLYISHLATAIVLEKQEDIND